MKFIISLIVTFSMTFIMTYINWFVSTREGVMAALRLLSELFLLNSFAGTLLRNPEPFYLNSFAKLGTLSLELSN